MKGEKELQVFRPETGEDSWSPLKQRRGGGGARRPPAEHCGPLDLSPATHRWAASRGLVRPVRVLIDPSGLGAFPGLCQLVKERIPCLSCNPATMPPRPGRLHGDRGTWMGAPLCRPLWMRDPGPLGEGFLGEGPQPSAEWESWEDCPEAGEERNPREGTACAKRHGGRKERSVPREPLHEN